MHGLDLHPRKANGDISMLYYSTRSASARSSVEALKSLAQGRLAPDPDLEPPRYIIDLSLPPSQRYLHLVKDYKQSVGELSGLFDTFVADLLPRANLGFVKRLARFFLRRVYDEEETEEIRGIAHATGVEPYLLVAFNVLLDHFMGCTSGGVRVRDDDGTRRMLHFRTLDWSLDTLRRIIVRYDFVPNPGAPVVATVVTYFGYVGVLTGVRKGLSMSLGFRPCHDSSTMWKAMKLQLHQLLVLLGYRPSISSLLRKYLMPSKYEPLRQLPGLVEIEQTLPSQASTAAYLVFCNGERTTSMEKDHRTAVVRSASDLIVALNHDVANEGNPGSTPSVAQAAPQTSRLASQEGLAGASLDRKKCVMDMWRRDKKARGEPTIQKDDLFRWVQHPEISNPETHYAVVMDPQNGDLVLLKRFLEPLQFGKSIPSARVYTRPLERSSDRRVGQ